MVIVDLDLTNGIDEEIIEYFGTEEEKAKHQSKGLSRKEFGAIIERAIRTGLWLQKDKDPKEVMF